MSFGCPTTVASMKNPRRANAAKSDRRRVLEPDEISAFTHVGDELLERVTLIRTNLLPPAADGMTLGKFVLLRGDQISKKTSTLLAHELVHVRQFAENGPIRFLSLYVGSYLKNLFRLRSHRQAYLNIPFEIEARAEAAAWKQDNSGD